jgi:hypothetical protein
MLYITVLAGFSEIFGGAMVEQSGIPDTHSLTRLPAAPAGRARSPAIRNFGHCQEIRTTVAQTPGNRASGRAEWPYKEGTQRGHPE